MKKNILIVDDSALMRRVISDIIASDDRLTIADTASNGLQAFDLVTLNPKKYDLILLDINMPKMNGIEFLEQLEKLKLRQKIIIVSTLAKEGAKETIRCLELGAFDFVTKPESFLEAKNDSFKKRVLGSLWVALSLPEVVQENTEKNMPGARIGISTTRALHDLTASKVVRKPYVKSGAGANKIVALACSTGGPKALQQVIPKLSRDLDAPMLVVQHMPKGFTNSLAARLHELSEVTVKEAEHGDVLQKGVVYIAKGGCQMRVVKKREGYTLSVTEEPARNGLKPCADIMYESLLDTAFDDITCVVLTGMGGDGTLGIKQLNDKKNIYVIAQDEPSCTVYGMPKVVHEAGLTDEVVDLSQIAGAIQKNVGVQKNGC
ncbi:MAG: chemotaxis response regulator protein-glutamate methylesterase [Lachnospiraceae bacterium]|nr:chemotaxis response regulator protein-glutamate methylesterase [Lachnospiraceae bacterium]